MKPHFPVFLDKLIHMVTQVPTFLGLASSDIKWQFVMGTPEGTMITLTILGVQVWDWGSLEGREKKTDV